MLSQAASQELVDSTTNKTLHHYRIIFINTSSPPVKKEFSSYQQTAIDGLPEKMNLSESLEVKVVEEELNFSTKLTKDPHIVWIVPITTEVSLDTDQLDLADGSTGFFLTNRCRVSQDQAEDLAERYTELRVQLEDRCNMLETAHVADSQFNEHLKAILDVATMETELNLMVPTSNQLDQTNKFFNRQIPYVKVNKSGIALTKLWIEKEYAQIIHNILESDNAIRYTNDFTDCQEIRQKKEELYQAPIELLIWIQRTDTALDEIKPVLGDLNVIEMELEKLKALIKEIQAHQTNVDNLIFVETIHKKLSELIEKATNRQQELEDAKNHYYLLLLLKEIESSLSMTNPVIGGLPETASEQLQYFMEVYTKLEETKPMVDNCLQRVADLGTLKQCWDNVVNLADNKKVKLEKALEEANEFHDALHNFVDWLTVAEKTLSGFKPVCHVLETVRSQTEEHELFQRDIEAKRQCMMSLDNKATHLKHYSRARDVILIKNLLTSVKHRWKIVLSRANERTRALDHAFKAAKEYHSSWNELNTWLNGAIKKLDDTMLQLGKDSERIKHLLAEHKDFQRNLCVKQGIYNDVIRQLDELVTNCAPNTGGPVLIQMASDLKGKWQSVWNTSVVCQRKIEEELLLSGHFQDAIQVLVDWLCEIDPVQMSQGPVDGDLDTIIILRQQHKDFQEELNVRLDQTRRVRRMIMDSMADWNEVDKASILNQLSELETTWENVTKAMKTRSALLDDALCRQEKRNYFEKLEKVKNFNWNNWKHRFTKYMNWKKFIIIDLYNQMDKSNEGFIPRENFIEGISRTKFPTSHVEMNVVSNMFDRNNEGFIDWMEFVDALRLKR